MAGDIELDNLQAPLQGSPEPRPPSHRGKWIFLAVCCSFTVILTAVLAYNLVRRSPPLAPDGQAITSTTTTSTTSTTTTTTFSVPNWPAQVAVGSLLSTLDGNAAPCADMWSFTCGSRFSERPRLSVVQNNIISVLSKILSEQPEPVSAVYSACQSAPRLELHHQTALDVWSFGFEVDGIFVSATANSFEKFKPIQLFITTTRQRRGPSVFLPYDVLDCPGPLSELREYEGTPPAIRSLLGKPVYTDFGSAVCQKLKKINVTAPVHNIVTDLSSSCERVVAGLYPESVVTKFVHALPPTKYTIRLLFDGAVSKLLRKIPASWPSRFRAKLRALRLDVGPTSFSSSATGVWAGNFTDLYFKHLRSQWYYELSSGSPPTYMYPWDVNAFYSPDTNAVTIPTAMAHLWSPSLPLSAYATTVGFVVAHEVSHSLDPFGIHFDEAGAYSPIALPHDYRLFINCLRTDASQSGLHPNQTVGEIFADRVGMETVNALANFTAGKSLNLYGARTITPGQFAFMLFVRSWCDSPQRESGTNLNYTIENDPHPPNRFRIEETLRGLPAFNTNFDCSRRGCGPFGASGSTTI